MLTAEPGGKDTETTPNCVDEAVRIFVTTTVGPLTTEAETSTAAVGAVVTAAVVVEIPVVLEVSAKVVTPTEGE